MVIIVLLFITGYSDHIVSIVDALISLLIRNRNFISTTLLISFTITLFTFLYLFYHNFIFLIFGLIRIPSTKYIGYRSKYSSLFSRLTIITNIDRLFIILIMILFISIYFWKDCLITQLLLFIYFILLFKFIHLLIQLWYLFYLFLLIPLLQFIHLLFQNHYLLLLSQHLLSFITNTIIHTGFLLFLNIQIKHQLLFLFSEIINLDIQ